MTKRNFSSLISMDDRLKRENTTYNFMNFKPRLKSSDQKYRY